jgi:hypothetical protein
MLYFSFFISATKYFVFSILERDNNSLGHRNVRTTSRALPYSFLLGIGGRRRAVPPEW